MLAECEINFPGGGWVAGLTKNKANSAQLGLAGAWAELGNISQMLIIPFPVLAGFE